MAGSGLGGIRVLGYGQQGPGQAAVQALGQQLAGFGPQAPPPQAGGQQAATTASAVVAELMLDRRASQLFLQSIDGWLRGGAQVPFQAPLPLPPQQAQQLQHRLAALAQQGSPYLAVHDLQTSTPPRLLPGAGVVTATPSRDRLAKQLLDRTALARTRQGLGKGSASLTPPKAVQAACKRGLELAPEHGGDGLTDGALDRARQMAAGQAVSLPTVKRIKAFHSRHSSYEKEASPPSPGYVAQQLWGGAAGKTWAESHADRDPEATEKATAKWERKGWVGAGGAWATAKRKARAAGKDDAYAAAIYRQMTHKSTALAVLTRHLHKSGTGPGSRGGHVIGTSRSGKPIYSAQHERYSAMHQATSEAGSTDEEDSLASHHAHRAHPGWSRQDHLDAAQAHYDHAGTLGRGDHRAQAHTAAQGHAIASLAVDHQRSPPETDPRAQTKKGGAPVATSALVFLRNHLSKAGGPGSRGGRVIGFTKTNKPIYASGQESKASASASHHPANSGGLGKKLTSDEDSGLHMAGHEAAIKETHDKHFSGMSADDHREAAEAHHKTAFKIMADSDMMDKFPRKFANHAQARNFHTAAAHVLSGTTAKPGHGRF